MEKKIEIEEEDVIAAGFVYWDNFLHGKSGYWKHVNDGFYLHFNNHLKFSIFNNGEYIDMRIEYLHELKFILTKILPS